MSLIADGVPHFDVGGHLAASPGACPPLGRLDQSPPDAPPPGRRPSAFLDSLIVLTNAEGIHAASVERKPLNSISDEGAENGLAPQIDPAPLGASIAAPRLYLVLAFLFPIGIPKTDVVVGGDQNLEAPHTRRDRD